MLNERNTEVVLQPDTVVEVTDLGKCYRVFARPQDRLWQSLASRAWTYIPARWRGTAPQYFREFWAIRGVSFSILRGESVGILGRNGAGKSTLLQLLAGTLTPTEGKVSVLGRVAALLELGSGFNAEYTGRENIFMNASILGLTESETRERLEDILSFAELGEFIDQPVKTYSSGMVMRLAFAVQTAVDPDLLIIDEALSVGDMFFQARCMTRMRQLLARGTTVLLVSHDVTAIRQLCQRAILIDQGSLLLDGDALGVTDHYVLQDMLARNSASAKRGELSLHALETAASAAAEHVKKQALPEDVQAWPSEATLIEFSDRMQSMRNGIGTARLVFMDLRGARGQLGPFDYGEEVTLRQFIRCDASLTHVNVVFKVRTLAGTDVTFMDTRLANAVDVLYEPGSTYCFEWRFRVPLVHGNYLIGSYIAHPAGTVGADWIFLDVITQALEFSVLPRDSGMIDGLVVVPARLTLRDCRSRLILEAWGE